MRRIPAAVAVVAVVGLGACGGRAAVHVATDPQVRASEARAQKIIQTCAVKSNFLTHSGRQRFVACIAPPGRKVQVEQCVTKKFASDGVITHRQRQRLEADIATCIQP